MPSRSAPLLPPWGGRGVGLLAREKSGRAAATDRKEKAPSCAPRTVGGTRGGFSGQLRRCGRIPAGLAISAWRDTKRSDWRDGCSQAGSLAAAAARRWSCVARFAGPRHVTRVARLWASRSRSASPAQEKAHKVSRTCRGVSALFQRRIVRSDTSKKLASSLVVMCLSRGSANTSASARGRILDEERSLLSH
jgi:hypothetical protein